MSQQAPGPESRMQRVARLLAASIVPSLLAVVAVASIITALYVWHQDEVATTEAVTSNQRASEPSPTSSPSGTPSPSPTQSTATASLLASATTPAPTTTSATPSPRKTSAKPAKQLSVVVLNQTRRTGLARAVAERLRARGWTVVQVANFRGNIGATTVYYPRGSGSQAAAIARDLPVPARTRPAFGNLSNQRLTVVITDNYPRQR